MAAFSEAKNPHKPLKYQDFVHSFENNVLIARVPQMPFELGFGPFFCGFVALLGPSCSLFFLRFAGPPQGLGTCRCVVFVIIASIGVTPHCGDHTYARDIGWIA